MKCYRLRPAAKDYLWGGTKLKREWGKQADTPTVAETWELSFHPDGVSHVAAALGAPEATGLALTEAVPRQEFGSKCARFPFFPVLVKLIDAADNLSVQVHPSDEYALAHEGQFGKTELWYVADCEPGAALYCGFQRELTAEEYARRIEDRTLLEVLNRISVRPGDCCFIPAGTVHAIGKGVTVCEVQQNSNLTYRVYDYGRRDARGNLRQLHIEKAKLVSRLAPYEPVVPTRVDAQTVRLASCPYFTVYELGCAGERTLRVDESSFVSFTVLAGSAAVEDGGTALRFAKGDTAFFPAQEAAARVVGDCRLLLTKVE